MKRDTILVFLTLFVSGNPVGSLIGVDVLTIALFFLLFSLWARRPTGTDWVTSSPIIIFTLISMSHVLIFGGIALNAEVGLLIRVATGLLLVLVCANFPLSFVSVMSFLCWVSLAFWLPRLVGVDTTEIFGGAAIVLPNHALHNIFFNFGHDQYRNFGMFWEPGAFAGYCALALFLCVAFKPSSATRMNVLGMVLALLTTLSTTGYLAATVVLVVWVMRARMKGTRGFQIFLKVFFGIIALGFALVLALNLSFVGDKILDQSLAVQELRPGWQINRLGNALYDWNFIKERPIVGWGNTPQTRFALDSELEDLVNGQGNQLTGFIVANGFVGIFAYFWFTFRGIRKLTGSRLVSISGIVSIAILFTGEKFLNYTFFFSLMFLAARSNLSSSQESAAFRSVVHR